MQDLISRRDQLLKELRDINRQIEDQEQQHFKILVQDEALVKAYADGKHIIKSLTRLWWVDANGDLLDMLDAGEEMALNRLIKSGVFEHCTNTYHV